MPRGVYKRPAMDRASPQYAALVALLDRVRVRKPERKICPDCQGRKSRDAKRCTVCAKVAQPAMPRPILVDVAKDRRLVAAYREGDLEVAQIAAAFGVPDRRIWRALRRAGVAPDRSPRKALARSAPPDTINSRP